MRGGIALVAVGVSAAIAAGGCQTVGPSALSAWGRSGEGPSLNSNFSYLGGRASQTFAPPTATVQAAAVAAMDDLRITSVRQINEGGGAVVYEGTTADNRKATVTIRPHPAGTRLTARIGLFGDEPLSRALMDRVGVRLGALPPSAIPVEPPSQPGSNPYFSRTGVPDTLMFKDQAEAPYRNTAVP